MLCALAPPLRPSLVCIRTRLSLNFSTIFDNAPNLGIATIKKVGLVVPHHPIGIGPGRDKIWLHYSPWLHKDPLGIDGAVPDPNPALNFANSSAMVDHYKCIYSQMYNYKLY